MQVFLYNLAKRNRSTLVVQSSGTALNCTLKDATSITKPVLLFQTVEGFKYNYCYIPDFDRFYFVSVPQSVEGMWQVACIEDYLASFKTEIGATRCNILYAHGSTKNIPDQRIPVTANLLKGHNYKALDNMVITEGMGAIILGLTGKGSFGSYLLQDSNDISELLDGVDVWFPTNVTSTLDSIKQFFYGGSAAECLKSAIAIPLVIGGPDISSVEIEDLYLGNYPCKTSSDRQIKAYKIDKPILNYSESIDIPWQSSDWRRISAYTDISLYLPMIGLISIPATEVMNDSSISIKYAINVTSGDISAEIRGTQSERKIAVASGNCAMNTAYGSTGIDTSKTMSAIVSGAGTLLAIGSAVATGGASLALSGGIGAGLTSTALNTIAALGGNGQGSGGLGGGSSHGLDKVIHIFVTQKELSDTQEHFDEIMGKPYMSVGTPNQFTGYVQTDGFQFKSDRAYAEEKDMINQLMDSGIYYE